MSDFLSKLYEEEMSKTGSAELGSLMRSLPKGDLESYLKLAADSNPPVEAPADDGKKNFKPNAQTKPEAKHDDEQPETNLDKKAARVLGVMRKMAVAGPAEAPLPDSAKGLQSKQDAIHKGVQSGQGQKVTVPVDHQGPGKEAVETEQGGKKVTTTKEAMAWADNMGRQFAREYVESLHEKVAEEKAKIAMTSIRASLHAPENIKQASIAYAGQLMAKLAAKEEPDWYDRMNQYQQAMQESKGLNVGVGGLAGALLGGAAAHAGSGGKGLHTALGALGGGALGGGLGYLSSRLAAKKRKALQMMGRGE